MKNIYNRYIGLSSPAAIFILGVIAIQRLPQFEATLFVQALMLSHMTGALPGIALAMQEISKNRMDLRGHIFIRVFILALISAFAGFLISESLWAVALIGTASVVAFFDFFSKRYAVDYIVPARISQTICIGLAFSVVFFWEANESWAYLMVRIASNFSVIIVLTIFLYRKRESDGGASEARYLSVAKSYAWLVGSNGVFIIPIFFIGQSVGAAAIAYAAQSALQMAGRLSDHLTLNSIRGIPVRGLELILTALGAFVFLFTLIFFTAKVEVGEYIIVMAIALSMASIFWGFGDSIWTTYSVASKGDFSGAAAAGLAALFIAVFISIIGRYLFVGNAVVYLSVVSILVGGVVYAGMANKKAKKV